MHTSAPGFTLTPDKLRRLDPLGVLSAERLHELADRCRIERTPRHGAPFELPGRDGFDGQTVYLVAGELKLSHADGTVEVLVGGCDAAIRPLPRDLAVRAEVRAITDVELLHIDSQLLDVMLTWEQLAAQADAAAPAAGSRGVDNDNADGGSAGERTDWHTLSGAFRVEMLTAGVLSQLPPANIDVLLRRFERVRVQAGDVVIREGEDGDCYYLIESGRCAVSRRVGGADVPLAELKGGAAFGEEALVADGRRNATVRMRTAGVLLRLGKADFDALLRAPLLKRVSWPEASRRAADGALWLDVRYPAEFQNDRLPGAINIPLNEIRNAIGPLDSSKEYIVYCQSGRRSSAAAFILSQHGYRAAWLEGGLPASAHY